MRFLLTTLPANDLGLLARSLPIARELSARGHEVVFCSPAPARSRVVADTGFGNLVPDVPLYDLVRLEPGPRGLARLLARGWHHRGGPLAWLRDLVRALPWRPAPCAEEVWNADHAGAVVGMLNPGFVRAHCRAMVGVIRACAPDVIVDFWNPFAAIAARATSRPVVTVIQADAHSRSRGFIWWKPSPAGLPAPAAVVNQVLADYERSQLLVHHGGYGSCQTGLVAGKPAVIMPTFSERESNARRMAALGAALMVPVDRSDGEKRVRAEDLRAAVRRVLAEPSYAEQARRAGERLRALGGAGCAATLIERFARGDGRSTCDEPRPR